jgi:uncharacterized damage-inducible protein DinB
MQTDVTELVRKSLIDELETLRDEVRQAADSLTDQQLWQKPIEPGNSVGNLILHLTGNLNHFIGAQLGGTGYVRDRDREFSGDQRVPRESLLANMDKAVTTFRKVVSGLSADQLAATHPTEKFGSVLKTLVHLVAHFALHRGQVSYILRMIKSPAN